MKLPASLTTVTRFSKILALILFITLPFFWFYLGLIIGVKQGGGKDGCAQTSGTLSSTPYSPNQLRKTYTHAGYDYAEIWRANVNIPIPGSTNYSGVVRKTTGSDTWQEYIEIVSDPDQAKNNPYKLWVGDDFYLMLVDQYGAGSGEGLAKLVKIDRENNTYGQVKCFYYVPETHEALVLENLLVQEDSLSDNCFNYSLEFE